MELNTKWGKIKVYAKTLEDTALAQITEFANSVLGENANIRIMPDAHAGAGCVIGTTMLITDKVCPNLVGVDIGCGVDLVKTNIEFEKCLPRLDEVIRKYVPFGKNRHDDIKTYRDFSRLHCWRKLKREVQETAVRSLGTLGGGNHFIEAYANGYLSVHSGSRNIGYKVAEYYQDMAEKHVKAIMDGIVQETMQNIPPHEREAWLREQKGKYSVEKSLAYLTGDGMEDYLHDMKIMQEFAVANRKEMLRIIVEEMGGEILKQITSTHNHIDISEHGIILRKGAISARYGETLVIPLNMRDGLLLCIGKGNTDWNFSAPHGAGRLYSRSKAKQTFSIEEYEKSMEGIFTTCINKDTLDEAPFAYKDYTEIMECIEPTVSIVERLVPIFNFKATE